MSLEVKSDAKFLVYLARKCITRRAYPKNFELVSSVHFCTLRNCYKFLRCSNGWLKVQAIILRKNLTLIVDASSVDANKLTFERELN